MVVVAVVESVSIDVTVSVAVGRVEVTVDVIEVIEVDALGVIVTV